MSSISIINLKKFDYGRTPLSVGSDKPCSKRRQKYADEESKDTHMKTQAQMRALAREALKLVKSKAPAIVDEQILAHISDEVSEFTGDIMGKLTNLDAENEKAITMAHGIIRDGLWSETMNQIRKTMLAEADIRITKLFKK
jgi:hypothetical protein